MLKAIWRFFLDYRRRRIETEIRCLDAEILPISRKLLELLARQRDLRWRYGCEKHVGEKFSTDEFIALHVDVPNEISLLREGLDWRTKRREAFASKLASIDNQFFFVTEG